MGFESPAVVLFFDSVAQLVEQRPFKPWVLGSSPSGVTRAIVAELEYAPDLKSVARTGLRVRVPPVAQKKKDGRPQKEFFYVEGIG